jgi:hypothetical protein
MSVSSTSIFSCAQLQADLLHLWRLILQYLRDRLFTFFSSFAAFCCFPLALTVWAAQPDQYSYGGEFQPSFARALVKVPLALPACNCQKLQSSAQ